MDTTLPYRPNVGIALFNPAGLVFAGMALNEGPEQVVAGFEWQMPQGGIDPDEDLELAARRELFEETGISDVSFLAATETWWAYDFPPYAGPPHSLSGFRGQTQRWVALRFDGREKRHQCYGTGKRTAAGILDLGVATLGIASRSCHAAQAGDLPQGRGRLPPLYGGRVVMRSGTQACVPASIR